MEGIIPTFSACLEPEGRPNIQKRVIWSSMDWALLKFTVARTVTPNDMKDNILMKEVSLGTTCALHLLSGNTILEMIRNLKNDQYQFLTE